MATNWSSTDEIDACNGDFVMAIIKVITGNNTPTKNHLILSVYLFGLNLKQKDIKTKIRERYPLSFLSPPNTSKRKNERAPRQRRGENGGPKNNVSNSVFLGPR